MTKDEALTLALEALEELHAMIWGECPSLLNEDSGGDSTLDMECKQAITAIKEALAQPEQEPVAWMKKVFSPELGEFFDYKDGAFARETDCQEWTPLYTTPPQRKPLTDEQIMANDVLRYHFALNGGAGPISKQGRKVIDAVEAAHGIKEKT